jgi:hypothetical protein
MNHRILTFALFVIGTVVLADRSDAGMMAPRSSSDLLIRRLDDGVFYGAAPRRDADFAKLRRLGVRRIIDVRSYKVFASSVERRRAAKWGMTYERIPISFVPERTGTVPQVLSKLKKDGCGPVYLHCNLGSDRAGLLAALYRTEQFGWSPQFAWDTWKAVQVNPTLIGLDRYFWQRVGNRTYSSGR